MKQRIIIHTKQGSFFKHSYGTLTLDKNEALILNELPKDVELFRQSILKEHSAWEAVEFQDAD